MEEYFSKFRVGIIGYNHMIKTPIHDNIRIVYADWTASGRMFLPIEEHLLEKFLPFVANTHTETNYTGSMMTHAYAKARSLIKEHVGASDVNDVLIAAESGMTGVVNKFQRILGLRIHESLKRHINLDKQNIPVVFVTHMEHHSNHTSWLETIAEVVVVPPDENGLVSVRNFGEAVEKYKGRKLKFAAITSCSNVTGVLTPYMDIAELMHEYNGYCFVDFACSAPYVAIDMHEDDANGRYLDAIYFSPHKFLGGPGSVGILIFNKKLYNNTVPDVTGGGTVDWTNPWGEHKYIDDIYLREDGGTPAFLQTIRAALCIRLKEEMGIHNILRREKEMLNIVWQTSANIPNLKILAAAHKERLAIVSFNIEGLYYNLGVKILNDRFGIQLRGGCACAGTYGHYLLDIDRQSSSEIFNMIACNDFSSKPGWIRFSLHPTHTNEEITYIMNAISELAANHETWANDYIIDLRRESVKPKNLTAHYVTNSKINKSFEQDLVDYYALDSILTE
jgi:selenocysteine lyase/cysteine desulfurase